jgi:hypothetical protein
VGLGARLEQNAAALSHARDEQSHPAACRPSPLSVYTHLFYFILFLSILGGVAVGHSSRLVWLVALDVCWAFFMDF